MRLLRPSQRCKMAAATRAPLLAAFVLLSVNIGCTGTSENDVSSENQLPLWVFKCEPSVGCHRVSRHDPNLTGMYHESLEVCRSGCGRFGGLWPRPATAAISSQTILFHPMLMRFNLNDVPSETRPLLVEMTKKMTSDMLLECEGEATPHPAVLLVTLSVKSPDLTLAWNTDESYILDLQSKVIEDNHEVIIQVRGETIYGVRHGLETLSQLVSANRSTVDDQKLCSLNILAGAKVKDKPAYTHRGLLIDTARNFIPVENIMSTIDGMAASKFNVLHWHATDSQSFPIESTRVPLLTKYGAYSPQEIYTVDQIKRLHEYARLRGVRIILEIDSPAHAGNGWQWGQTYGLGDLAVCVNSQPWRASCIQPPCGQLNPANPHMYAVLADLYADVVEMWPRGEVLHMGGDEVFINCWNSSAEIVKYMETQGLERTIEGFHQLWANFHKKILELWDEENNETGVQGSLPVMLWSSELTQASRIKNYLNKDRYVIQVWEPVESPQLQQLISLGYHVVSTPKNIWYLDHGFWGATRYSNWRKMYSHRLPKGEMVLGGEVAMWGEYVDGSDLDARIWPRAASVAERLWADPDTSAVEAEPRMQRHRARLVSRGLRADTIAPAWCRQNDGACL